MNILITGGAGFIGAHLVRHMVQKYPNYKIVNLDALTYAADLRRLDSVANAPNYHFVQADLTHFDAVQKIVIDHKIEACIHLAAESHVDRSISGPLAFGQSNIMGTLHLLEACRSAWQDDQKHLFYHISTDEVYGSLGKEGVFNANSPYDPHSPYSASKAAADHLVRAYGTTYGMRYILSNCSNNYGPEHHREKLIPLLIERLKEGKPLPIYGDGSNVRDWLYITDHVDAIDKIFHKGETNTTYLIGGRCEKTNLEVAQDLCDAFDRKAGKEVGTSRKLITFVDDRPGHDQRYAIDPSLLEDHLGWQAQTPWQEGLDKTLEAYL